MNDVVKLLGDLIACKSTTPCDGGAFNILEKRLKKNIQKIGCKIPIKIKRKTFGKKQKVENFYARIGTAKPHLCFAGHVDVVPAGDESLWRKNPFKAHIENGVLYGRGAVDMKGAIACFILALEGFLKNKNKFGSISILLTSDEEGPAINGTKAMLEWLVKKGEKFDACLVGEPTSINKIGDNIKIGRRGSLSAIVRQIGVQGHVAYPHLAKNPLPILLPKLQNLLLQFDRGNKNFEKTNLEITSIDTGMQAFNVIPSEVAARFNVRFNDEWTISSLKKEIEKRLGIDKSLEIEWQEGSEAFLTSNEKLINCLQSAIKQSQNIKSKVSTGGGTSDARFIKNVCSVVECGLLSKTMHKIDECVAIADLENLSIIYENFLKNYFNNS